MATDNADFDFKLLDPTERTAVVSLEGQVQAQQPAAQATAEATAPAMQVKDEQVPFQQTLRKKKTQQQRKQQQRIRQQAQRLSAQHAAMQSLASIPESARDRSTRLSVQKFQNGVVDAQIAISIGQDSTPLEIEYPCDDGIRHRSSSSTGMRWKKRKSGWSKLVMLNPSSDSWVMMLLIPRATGQLRLISPR